MKRAILIIITGVMLVSILIFGPTAVSARGGDELKPDISAPGAVVNGWYTDDVTLSWPIPSGATVAKGCEEIVIDFDTRDIELSCEVETKEGTLNGSVMIRRDITPPIININPPGPIIPVEVGEILVLDADESTDETSGVASIKWDLDLDGVYESENPVSYQVENDEKIIVFPVQVVDLAGNNTSVVVIAILT